jgi:hypothetical protein
MTAVSAAAGLLAFAGMDDRDEETGERYWDLRLSDYDIVHVATHSTINYSDPRRSKIWLSADTLSKDGESALTLAAVPDAVLRRDACVSEQHKTTAAWICEKEMDTVMSFR